MSDDELERRKELSFEQAEGLSPLPTQLSRDALPNVLRARITEVLHVHLIKAYSQISQSYQAPWSEILWDAHVRRFGNMPSTFENRRYPIVQFYEKFFATSKYGEFYGLIQWFLRHGKIPSLFCHHIDQVLEEERAAFRVIDKDTLMPRVTDDQIQTVAKAIADLSGGTFTGARTHLKSAATALGDGNYAESVRESIHAVESVARTIAPSGSLSAALGKLEANANIHKAMKAGFNSLYGFTSDEKGIRHPLLDEGDANVDETDAIFMFSACSAFVSYLIDKARAARLIE